MKEYLLLFRMPANITREESKSTMEDWKNWIGGIAGQGKLNGGQPLTMEGKHMKTKDSITDAPFAEGKEVVNGYLTIKADDYNDACALSKGCPVFMDGGSVEVREIVVMDLM